MQQLTTPEFKDFEATNPGENWFHYWKTSPSLWESKLASMHSAHKIFIPIYWAFHEEEEGVYDFAKTKPESDLKRLYEIIVSMGREAVFFIPLGPQPYLVNGGLPSYLARTLCLSEQSLGVTSVDAQGALFKQYSFFDPRVFQAFSRFIASLGRYLTGSGIQAGLYGLNAGYIRNHEFKSFFEDTSSAFDEGFTRYLKQKEIGENEELKDYVNAQERAQYTDLIWNLYIEGLKETVPGHYAGTFDVCFAGGAPEDIFIRSLSQLESSRFYFSDVFGAMSNDVYPSTSLLNPSIKKGPLDRLMKDLLNHDYVDSSLDKNLFIEEGSMSFMPYKAFCLVTGSNFKKACEEIEETGLEQMLNRSFKWMYSYFTEIKSSEDEDFHSKVIIANGDTSPSQFNELIKLFMSGANVIWNTKNFTQEQSDRIDSFIYENQLDVESINYLTTVRCIKLGEGKLILFNGDNFDNHSVNKKQNFWKELITFLGYHHVEVDAEEGVEYFWRSRETNHYEINYSELRRVSFYNPTSYKKTVKIHSSKNFAYLKSMDELNASIKSTPVGIEVIIQPTGSISLDYGFYE